MVFLKSGSHNGPDEGGCVMEVVSMLAKQPWTDAPTCTNEVVTRAAQSVNDRLNDTERQRLIVLIPRIMRARRTESDVRVNIRLAAWAARSVLHLVREQDREVTESAVRAVELWLIGEATEQELRAAASAAASASASAAAAAYAAASAASASASAAAAAYAAASAASASASASASAADYAASASASAAAAASAASASASASASAAAADYAASASASASASAAAYASDPVAWLDELLDVWEKAVNEEGEALWIPTEWEDEALAFLDEMNRAKP